ncbi:MAG TPA: SCO family protein [Fluviicola sp.]|nr:SCO family protein [Fluviicola sp.]
MRVVILLVIALAGIITAYLMTKPSDEKPLPVINPIDLNSEMVDADLARQGFGHKIGDFSFTDQTGKAFGLKDVEGKVFVAEYFFSTCGTICPKMTAQMERVHQQFKHNNQVEILSFTVDPANDTVARLAEYAKEHHADSKQWHFLTGEKEKLYEAARRSFFVLKPAAVENQGDVGSDFIHTNNFVLIDKQLRIRGYYDGTSAHDVDRLMKDMERLLEE